MHISSIYIYTHTYEHIYTHLFDFENVCAHVYVFLVFVHFNLICFEIYCEHCPGNIHVWRYTAQQTNMDMDTPPLVGHFLWNTSSLPHLFWSAGGCNIRANKNVWRAFGNTATHDCCSKSARFFVKFPYPNIITLHAGCDYLGVHPT